VAGLVTTVPGSGTWRTDGGAIGVGPVTVLSLVQAPRVNKTKAEAVAGFRIARIMTWEKDMAIAVKGAEAEGRWR